MLNELAARIRFHNDKQGFTVTKENIDQKLLLAVSEVCEAQEELRDGHTFEEVYYADMAGLPFSAKFDLIHNFPTDKKPEGFSVEIADAIIRLLDICHATGINIDQVIELKLAYNQTRPLKHGRQF